MRILPDLISSDYCRTILKDLSNAPLGGLARAHVAKGDMKLAREFTEKGADKLSAAKVWLALGEKARAKEAALRAYEKNWADGPPYAFWWNLKHAREILEKLGEPLPDLPPFDEARASAELIYHESEILAVIETLETGNQGEVDSH